MLTEKDLETFDEVQGDTEDAKANLAEVELHLDMVASVETAEDLQANLYAAVTEATLLLMELKALHAKAAKLATKEKTKGARP